jgi:hypothetical protein
MTLARLQLNHQNAAALRFLHAALARKNCEELNAWFHQRAETKRLNGRCHPKSGGCQQ